LARKTNHPTIGKNTFLEVGNNQPSQPQHAGRKVSKTKDRNRVEKFKLKGRNTLRKKARNQERKSPGDAQKKWVDQRRAEKNKQKQVGKSLEGEKKQPSQPSGTERIRIEAA